MSKHNHRDKYENFVLKGFGLPEAEIPTLEADLRNEPSDLKARFQLLGFYSRTQHIDKSVAKKLTAIAIWLIDNMPDCGVLENWCRIDETLHGDLYEELKQHWLAQLERAGDNVGIITSAAAFFTIYDSELSETLYRRAIELDPSESDWSRNLAYLLHIGGLERAVDALNAMRDALRKQEKLSSQYYLLTNLAELAFDAAALDEASEAAHKSLSLAFTFGDDWNDGNAVHNCNCVLGRIALKNGDIEAAKKHLALAGATPGSPQLNSFGPDMDLAEELYAAGEIDAVVSYLEACKKFWASACERGALDRGIDQIRRGETPNFAHKFAEYDCDGEDDCDHE